MGVAENNRRRLQYVERLEDPPVAQWSPGLVFRERADPS